MRVAATLLVVTAIACGSKRKDDPPSAGDAAAPAGGPLTLGSDRFRIDGQINDLQFGNDGALYVLLYGRGLHAMDPVTGIFELKTELDMQEQRMARLASGELAIVGSSNDGHNGLLAVWSPTDRSLRLHPIDGGPIADGDVDATGRELVVSGRRRPLVIVSPATGAVLETIDPATPDWHQGHLLGSDRVVASRDGQATVFDRKTGAALRQLAIGNHEELWPSPDGSHLIADRKVWRLDDGAVLANLLPGSRVVAWHRDGNGYYTGDDAGRVASWTRDGTVQWEVAVDAGEVHLLEVSNDGLIAIATRAGGVRIIDPGTRTVRAADDGHSGAVRQLAFVGDRLLSAAGDDTVRSWDPATGHEQARMPLDGRLIALEPTTTGGVAVLLVDRIGAEDRLETRDPSLALTTTTALIGDAPSSIGRGAAGELVAVTYDTVFELDAATGRSTPSRGDDRWRNGEVLPGGVAVFESDDGLVLAAGGLLKTTDCIEVAGIASDAAGSRIAVADRRGDLRLWKRDGTLVAGVHLDEPYRAGDGSIAGDGSFGLFGTDDGVLLWEISAGTVAHAAVGRVTSIALRPESRQVALGLVDGRILLWDLAALRAVAVAVTAPTAPAAGDEAGCKRKHDADLATRLEYGGYVVLESGDGGGGLGRFGTTGGLGDTGTEPSVPCTGITIDLDAIADGNACRAGKGDRALPGDDQLVLEVESPLRVAAGKKLAIPYTLRWLGDAAVELDLEMFHHSAFQPVEVRRDGTLVLPPQCGMLQTGYFDTARVTVEPGGKLTGTIPWRAANHDFGPVPVSKLCDPLTSLAAGRYTVTFELFTQSEPRRRATVEIKVTR